MGNCLGGGGGENSAGSHTSTTAPPRPVNPVPPPAADPTPGGETSTLPVSSSTKVKLNSASVLGRETEDLKTLFSLGKELGRGQFGITYLCTDKITGEQLACKSIAKRKLQSKEDTDDVRREVAIMHHLEGHPNIVKLRGAYEDKQSVHIVMELCAGGELFDRIIARGHYSEKGAASLIRTIVKVVQACHAKGVMHRDLKPENFLLANKKEDAPLKATDFGLSVFFQPGETFTDIVGSAYYVAPEVLRRKYGPEADIWSCGVILYILLCGVPPFWAENEQGIFDAVLRGQIDFVSDPWPSVSVQAKDAVKKMLKQDPKERFSASQVLQHAWVREDGEASDAPLDSSVVDRLKRFSAMGKMKKLALTVIAKHLSGDEISRLKELFKSIDTDDSGSITYDEMKNGLLRQGTSLPESAIQELMASADVDNDGTIDYAEFITATMHLNMAQREDALYQAFRHFDADDSGYISMTELKQALSGDGSLEPEEIDELIKDVDVNNDGHIDYEEFATMMRKGNPAFENNNRSSIRDVFNLPVGPPKKR
eukprot:TRINITY_DN838_c0_g1_i1.p1 TRINITY_DN838_c0_g1~~TRINITY_DN838_c0_g1_i1.p1  ORF type:complete len:540 (+),score=94.11 TRINITY_DN838_c0_g1_i1:139-1758(+)